MESAQMYRIMDQMLNGVAVVEIGSDVEEFKRAFARDMATADANGWIIDIPYDPALRLDEDISSPLLNAFCATGKGGGIDPTCSPDEAGKGKGDTPLKAPSASKLKRIEMWKAVVKIAKAKFKSVPEPTKEEKKEAKEGLARLGANKYRRNLVGNTKDRAKRRAAIFKEFGDGKKCPCTFCGISLKEGTLEQDKILTTAQGGRYRMPNLIPSCSGCNKVRGDKPFAAFIKTVKPK